MTDNEEPVPAIGAARWGALFGAMFAAVLGIDFLFNAGLLARMYERSGTSLLPLQELYRRIPYGYASFAPVLALMSWLMLQLRIATAAAGARFGGFFGGMLGAAGALALYSIVNLGADFLAAMALCQCVQYAVAGAICGAGIGGARIGKLYGAAMAVLIGGFVIAVLLQNLGFAAAPHH